MFNTRKKILAKEKIIEDLMKDNQRLGQENQDLEFDLYQERTKNVKLNTVLSKLIIAICCSEDEQLLKNSNEILKILGE